MAQKVQVLLVDDVDGSKADETVKFALDGNSYEIDLSSAHASELRAAISPWIAAGRKVAGRSSSRGRSGASDTAKIRTWAKSTGMPVSERGRVSAEVRAAYAAAH